MEKIVIIGGGGHAKSIIAVIKKIGVYKILGYVDVEDHGKILGVSYLGNDDKLKNIKKKHSCHYAALGVGAVNISDKRQKVVDRLISLGLKFPTIISPTAIINEDVKIGKGTIIHDGVVINSGTRIGMYTIVNNASCIEHDCRIGNFVHIASGAILSGGVVIGDNSLIGAGSTIVQYKTIGKDCLVAAGAVVVGDCLESGTYKGIPAKK